MRDDIEKAIDVLRAGGVILYPTDTIWGLGCDATNAAAVERVFAIKRRAETKGMLVLVDAVAKLPAYVAEVPDMAWDLVELATRPLTIIYPHARNLAPNLISADNSIGIRVTGEVFSNKLCAAFRKPIVSTSANVSGAPAPAFFREISDEIRAAVDYVVKYRQTDETAASPSSIIRLGVGNEIEIIRK